MIRVIVRAPVLSQSGYGEHARFVVRSLRSQPEKFDVYIVNIKWGQTSWLWECNEEREWFDERIKATNELLSTGQNPNFDLSVQVTIPNEWQKMAQYNVGVTAGIEVDKISPVWIEKSQLMDKIIVPSEFSKAGFDNTSYQVTNNHTGEVIDDWRNQTPIEVVPYPVKKTKADKNFKLDLKSDFNFLAMAQWGPRKNIDSLVKWFVEEFHDDENVGLILKTSERNNSVMDRVTVRNKIQEFLKNNYPEKKCKINILHGYLKEEEVKALFQHDKVKAFVTTTHGEGWCLPMFDAAIEGVPVVAPKWSAYLDFMTMPMKEKNGKVKDRFCAVNVEHDIAQVGQESVWEGVIEKDSKWCHPKEFSFKHSIRKLYNNYSTYEKRAKQLQKHVLEKYEEAKVFEQMVNTIYDENDEKLSWMNQLSEIEIL